MNQFFNGLALRNQDYTPLVTKNMRSYLGAGERVSNAVDKQIAGMVQKVAGKNPIVYTGLAVSAGPVNMCQYALRLMRSLVLDILLPGIEAIASEESGMTVVHGLWGVIYQTKSDYETFILASELRSCIGLQMMLGQTNPFARLAGSVCESGVSFKRGAVQTAMAFFVDLPMLACLCTDSQLGDYKAWAMTHCYDCLLYTSTLPTICSV